MVRVLRDRGFEVDLAVDGQGALDALSGTLPHIILLDVMMPGMTGYELCKKLRRAPETASIPIVLVTALKDRDERLRGIRAGADDFVTKPVDIEEMVLRVGNWVRTRKIYEELSLSYDRLRELESLRESLSHMIAHDMRSPLTAIRSCLQMLHRSKAGGLEGPRKRLLERADRSAFVLIEMVNALLDVGRFEAGSMPLQLISSDLNELARSSVDLLSPLAGSRTLTLDLPLEPVNLTCDADVIERVIANLVGNALKFAPPAGHVGVVVRRVEANGHARVSVQDDGPGIPPEAKERIFEKFGQIHLGEGQRAHSTGLGLTFCKLAVEAHGGAIGVESDPGQGAKFWFHLPAVG